MPDAQESRTLPILKKDQQVKHDSLGVGVVLKDEESGTCLIHFDGRGTRDLHMGLAHLNLRIADVN